MFSYNTNIYLIGFSQNIIDMLINQSSKNITIIYSDDVEFNKLNKADYIMSSLDIDGVLNLLSLMKDLNKKTDTLILYMYKQDIDSVLDLDDNFLDILNKDISAKEMAFHFKKLSDNINTKHLLFEYKHILNTIINTSQDLIWVKDINGSHKMFNNNFLDALPAAKDGHKKTYEECVDRGHLFLWELSEEDYAEGEFICMESEYDVIEANATLSFDEELIVGSGEMRQLITKKSPLHDKSGNIIGTVGVAKDITKELLYMKMLEKNATTDFLTGLFNRRYMYDLIESNRYTKFSVLFMDLDNFKYINDKYGHNKGDEALILTSKALKNINPDFTVGRMGGDEFIIFIQGEENLENISAHIKEKIKELYSTDECFEKLDISIGFACNNPDNPDIESLISAADNHMYKTKMLQKASNTIKFA